MQGEEPLIEGKGIRANLTIGSINTSFILNKTQQQGSTKRKEIASSKLFG